MNYYNEIEPYAAAWLQNLMDAGHIPAGLIDTRSIEDVIPTDLAGFTQCHFFAGIGGWPLALRLAGWPDSRPAWTGSCPCQPFSAAGKGAGFDDERHLWPAWQHLIAQCRPAIIFGEQVASKAVDAWIDLVHADLEGMGYAFGGIAFPAAGIGAPHIRDRTYWVGHADVSVTEQPTREWARPDEAQGARSFSELDGPGTACGMGHADSARSQGHAGDGGAAGWEGSERPAAAAGISGGLADAASERRIRRRTGETCDESSEIERSERLCNAGDRPGPTNGQWADADWLGCTDGKWRPVEPGTFPLAHGIPGRVGRLRAYGNAIVPAQATEFISTYAEAAGLIVTDLEQAA